jgi:tape measure domain-containing protein
MADIAQLGIEIDTRKLKSGEKDLASFSSAAQKVDDTVKTATKTMLAFVGAASVGEIIKIADKMTMLNAKINLYTKSATEATAVMSQLNSIANASGSSIGAVSELYTRMASSLQSMGATQGQILQLTDTINKLGIVSGASPEAMSNAMMQLSQSMAGGIVRAEEFNSIVENTPMIAQEVAKSMGISMGELRNQMLAGKLSAQDFANALLSGSARADEMASKMPRTVGQATQALSNNFSQLVNAVNDATSSTSVISAAIDDVAASFLDLTNAFASGQIGKYAESFAVQWKTAGSDVTEVMRSIVDIFDAGLKAVDADGRDSAQFLSDAFWQFPANVKAAIQVIVVELASLVDKAAVYGEQIAFYLDPRNWGDGEQIDSYVQQKINGINKARDATIDGFMAERTAAISASNEMKKKADEVRAAFEKRAEANKIALSSAPITGGKTTSAATATGKGTDAAASKLATMQKNATEYLTEVSRFNATEAQQIQNWQTDQLLKLESFHSQGLVKESEYQFGKQAIVDEANRRLQKLNDDQWAEYLNGSSAALLKLKQQAQTQLTGPKQQIVVAGIDKKLQEQTFANLPTFDAGSQTNEQNQIAQLQTQTTAMNDAYSQRIDDYKRFRASEVENAAFYDSQIAALEKKKEENNKAAQEAMMNLQLQAGESMATSAADSLRKMVGEQSAAYQTMFAVQKAFSIQRAILAIKTGIASAWEAGWPNGAIYAAGVVAATGSLVSDIMSVASPSFDGGGYTGNGSRSGGLDGKGGFWAMMHPQETVIDHTKSGGKGVSVGGSSNVTVNVSLQETSDTSQQGTTQQSTSDDGSVQINVFVADIRSEGSMAQVLERTYGLSRVGA